LLLAPILVALILSEQRVLAFVAASVFVVGAASDRLDGYLARRHGAVSATGKWLDPLADKFLVLAPVLTLTALGQFPLWAAVVIAVREAAIVVLRIVLGSRGIDMAASPGAKIKTGLQIVAITLYILPLGEWARGLRLVVLAVALVVTVLTGIDYVVKGMRRVRGTSNIAGGR
jgi:CDP-diacylglycerol---glycerol-3-phosphate 3-phosphatidyltransferase